MKFGQRHAEILLSPLVRSENDDKISDIPPRVWEINRLAYVWKLGDYLPSDT